MAHTSVGRGFPDQRGARLDRRPASHEARLALRLVASGLVLAALAIVLSAATGLDASVGPLHLLGLLALIGLLTVSAGGVFAFTAIFRRGERSILVLATLPVSVFALLAVLAQVIFNVP
jgi:hypothetical protein